jgi:hypothetical protein
MKTSVYLPDDMAAQAKELHLSLSKIWQQAVLEHLVYAQSPGPIRHVRVTGATVADMLTLMTEASIPLSAKLAAWQDGDDANTYLEWKELPPESNGSHA